MKIKRAFQWQLRYRNPNKKNLKKFALDKFCYKIFARCVVFLFRNKIKVFSKSTSTCFVSCLILLFFLLNFKFN